MTIKSFSHFEELGFGKELVPVQRGGKQVVLKDWPRIQVSPADLAVWEKSGYSVGLRTKYYPTFDIDCDDPELADRLGQKTPVGADRRRSNSARTAVITHLSGEPFKKMRVSAVHSVTGKKAEVELLADGQQVVVSGQHPSGAGYDTYVPEGGLAPVDLQEATSVLQDIEDVLRNDGYDITSKPVSRQGSHSVNAAAGAGGAEHLDNETWSHVKDAMKHVPNLDEHWDDWVRVGMALRSAAGDDPERIGDAFELFDAWSAQSCKYDAVATHSKWNNDIDRNFTGAIGHRTIFKLAEDTGYWSIPRQAANEAFDDPSAGASAWDVITRLGGSGLPASKQRQQADAVILPGSWAGLTTPKRHWVVDGWVPVGKVTSLHAVGGLGKSLLMQQLSTCRALKTKWLGIGTLPGVTLFVSCEDDQCELHIRQDAINSHLMTDMQALGCGMGFLDRTGSLSNPLCVFDRDSGKAKLTGAWETVRDAAKSIGADLIVLDTVADVFPGDENSRQQVNAFVKGVLGTLITETAATVIFAAHPSKSALFTMSQKNSRSSSLGDGFSGSTAWQASVRSGIVLRQPLEDEAAPGSTLRVLTKSKANHASMDGKLFLEWKPPGYFSLVADGMVSAQKIERACEKMVQDALGLASIQGVMLRPDHRGGAYSPFLPDWAIDNVAPVDVPSEMITQKGLSDALSRLISQGEIKMGEILIHGGRKSRSGLVFT